MCVKDQGCCKGQDKNPLSTACCGDTHKACQGDKEKKAGCSCGK